jgi:hypothetical protein
MVGETKTKMNKWKPNENGNRDGNERPNGNREENERKKRKEINPKRILTRPRVLPARTHLKTSS